MNTPKHYDVAVIGGGPAGVAAAAAAGRSGAAVVLIERAARLGGSVTAALHRCLCGLYADEPKSPIDTLNDRVQREVVDRLTRKAPADVRTKAFGRAWVLEFPSAAYSEVLSDICRDAGVDVQLGLTFSPRLPPSAGQAFLPVSPPGIPAEDGRRTGGETGKNACPTGNVLIDCSGTGHLLQLADAAQPDKGESMLAGYGIRLANITGDPDLLRLQVPYFLKQAVDAGSLHPLARFTVFHPGPGPGEGVCKLAIDAARFSERDVSHFAAKVFDYLKSHVESLANATVLETSPHVMPRAGRRLAGKYVLTEQDVLSPRAQDDGDVAYAWWPVEQWDAASGPSYRFAEPGRPYAIPAAALQSARFDNLLAAGMCLSATHAAAASSRASGVCLATGEFAGRLAARKAGF